MRSNVLALAIAAFTAFWMMACNVAPSAPTDSAEPATQVEQDVTSCRLDCAIGGPLICNSSDCSISGTTLRCGTQERSCPTCNPLVCSDLGAQCGMIDNGCGGLRNCGTCAGNQDCSPDHKCIAACVSGMRCCNGQCGSMATCQRIENAGGCP